MALTTTQQGRLAETMIAAYCVLGSDGALNVSTPFVDDAGVDLIFNLKHGSSNIAVQVKSNFTSKNGRFYTTVGKKTLVPRDELHLLFVFIDKKNLEIGDTLWFVPSESFVRELGRQRKTRADYVFDSNFGAPDDMWRKYRQPTSQLPAAIMRAIEGA